MLNKSNRKTLNFDEDKLFGHFRIMSIKFTRIRIYSYTYIRIHKHLIIYKIRTTW